MDNYAFLKRELLEAFTYWNKTVTIFIYLDLKPIFFNKWGQYFPIESV